MSAIQLTHEQQETLRRLAEKTGRPPTEVLQIALASFEQQEAASNGTTTETVHAALLRLGLLGSVTDAPADLSTNPRYMEGFGTHGD